MFSFLQHGSMSLRTITFILFWASIAHAELKNVFFHYMITGMSDAQATRDVQDAKNLGVDAFALDLQSTTEQWSLEAVSSLFAAANANDFKLFFCFDMTWFTSPSQFLPYLVEYISNDAYYQHDGLPFVSTFMGGEMTFGASTPNEGWQTEYIDALAAMGHTTYFVPSFSEDNSYNGAEYYDNFPSTNGGFSWTCWPSENSNTSVTSTIDEAYLSARPDNKTYIMGLSPLQFKHLSPTENWYRSGSTNLVDRITQVLDLSPDFLEIVTWNDNGESHYFGNIWPDSMPASYSIGYNHTGWQALLPAFISAYKAGSTDVTKLVPTNGEVVQGTFWHHTLMKDADCSDDYLGKPEGYEYIQDVLSIGLYASDSADNLTMRAWSGGVLVGEEKLVTGLNTWNVTMNTGTQSVEVVDQDMNTVFGGEGSIATTMQSDTCNYNFQVVEIAAVNGAATTRRRDPDLVYKREARNAGLVKHSHKHRHLHRHLHAHKA